ncbi:hypothetical protein B484DRAFT_338665, partial [Ochromonadaceae sp. CCMP2298]
MQYASTQRLGKEHGAGYLNDELVNFSLELVYKRFRVLFGPDKADSIRYYNTHFMSTLENLSSPTSENPVYTYGNIARWSRRFKFFEAEKVFVPINYLNGHWVLIVIFPQTKEVRYYDSMCSEIRAQRYLHNCRLFLRDISADPQQAQVLHDRGCVFDISEWRFETCVSPQQENGWDCGVFVIRCVEHLIEDLPLQFNPSD